jgi:hypothetical protein
MVVDSFRRTAGWRREVAWSCFYAMDSVRAAVSLAFEDHLEIHTVSSGGKTQADNVVCIDHNMFHHILITGIIGILPGCAKGV